MGGTWAAATGGTWDRTGVVLGGWAWAAEVVDQAAVVDRLWKAEDVDQGAAVVRLWAAEDADQGVVVDRLWVAEDADQGVVVDRRWAAGVVAAGDPVRRALVGAEPDPEAAAVLVVAEPAVVEALEVAAALEGAVVAEVELAEAVVAAVEAKFHKARGKAKRFQDPNLRSWGGIRALIEFHSIRAAK